MITAEYKLEILRKAEKGLNKASDLLEKSLSKIIDLEALYLIKPDNWEDYIIKSFVEVREKINSLKEDVRLEMAYEEA